MDLQTLLVAAVFFLLVGMFAYGYAYIYKTKQQEADRLQAESRKVALTEHDHNDSIARAMGVLSDAEYHTRLLHTKEETAALHAKIAVGRINSGYDDIMMSLIKWEDQKFFEKELGKAQDILKKAADGKTLTGYQIDTTAIRINQVILRLAKVAAES